MWFHASLQCSVCSLRTYGHGPLWSVQICRITGNLCLNQVRQIAYQGGGEWQGNRGGEAAAGSDLWHSNCTVKCLVDMEEVIGGIKLWIYSC